MRLLPCTVHNKLAGQFALATLAVVVLMLGCAVPAQAQHTDNGASPAPRYGLGLGYGLGYDPGDAENFVLATGFALFDYEAIWPHAAPEALRFKTEAALGGTTQRSPKLMASVSGLALYYLDGLRTPTIRPYVEAGVGVIYTGHKVAGQGSSLNFNPQAGLGIELSGPTSMPIWLSLRLHHISNAGLHKDNRGVNSALLQAGWYFN